MSWLEHLFLVLLPEAHPVVDVFLSDLDFLDRLVLAHGVDVFLNDVRLAFLGLLSTGWANHVGWLLYVFRTDMGDLKGLHLRSRYRL